MASSDDGSAKAQRQIDTVTSCDKGSRIVNRPLRAINACHLETPGSLPIIRKSAIGSAIVQRIYEKLHEVSKLDSTPASKYPKTGASQNWHGIRITRAGTVISQLPQCHPKRTLSP
jgi:hypothetical protein